MHEFQDQLQLCDQCLRDMWGLASCAATGDTDGQLCCGTRSDHLQFLLQGSFHAVNPNQSIKSNIPLKLGQIKPRLVVSSALS